MKRALIQPEVCRNCNPCEVEVHCPMVAIIRESSSDKPWVDFYRCCGCMKCKLLCKNGALREVSHPCSGKASMGW